jgi:nucleoside-diphosphate-sugar epimerase
MRVLVTGATGYIGAVVAEVLAAAGHEVVAVARSERGLESLADLGYVATRGDLNDPESIAAAAAGTDAVVHLAATQDDTMGATEQATVRALLERVQGSGKAMIYTSGVWVYGSAPPGRMLDEDSPTDPAAMYAWRPALEAEVLAAAATGIRAVVIRPAMVYGRAGGPLNQFGDMAIGGVPRYVGDGRNHWTLVHVDDLAVLYLLALERAPAGTLVNGASGAPIEVRELAAAAAAGAGLTAPPVPWPMAEAAVELGADMAEALTRDHRIAGRGGRLLGWRPPAREPLDELRSASADPGGQGDRPNPDVESAIPRTWRRRA